MPLWIPIAIAAALFQCWRTAMQQKLRYLLSINGAGFVRFLYGAPAALMFLLSFTLRRNNPRAASKVVAH